MSNVTDVILKKLETIEEEQKQQGKILAVLQSQHDNGNKSERVAAGMAVFAILISIIVAMTSSCNKRIKSKEANTNGRRKPVLMGLPPSVRNK
jgi:hypothetical protein